MGKIIKNKDIVKILLCIFIFLASIIFFKFYQSYAAPQSAWPNSSQNYVRVTMNGPWGEGGLTINATAAWNDKKDGEKTTGHFIARDRTVTLKASAYGDSRYNARLLDTSMKTTSTGGSTNNYAVITFRVAYTVPAHYIYGSYAREDRPGGRFNCSVSIPHDSANQTVEATYEVNVSRFGMTIMTETGTRKTGSWSRINLTRSSVNVQWYNGYSGGWASLGTKYCGDRLGNLPTVSRQYYDFEGWYNEHGNEVDANTIVCTDDEWFAWVTARWVHRTAEVTFYPEGGIGNMGIQTVNLGERTALKANTFTRETYKFIGWTLDPESRKVDYPDKQPITLTNEDGLELYAVWQKEDTGFDTQEVIEDAEMFGADGELEGGAGTVFDRNRTDSRFAHIDGGESDPAYFTKK